MQIIQNTPGPAACPDDHQSGPVSRLDHQLREVRPNTQPGLPGHTDAVQHLTVHSGAPAEDATQSPVRSPTLDDQPVITARDLLRLLGMVVLMAALVPRGRLRLRLVQWLGARVVARSSQCPGGFTVQSRPDTEHRMEDGHGASPDPCLPSGANHRLTYLRLSPTDASSGLHRRTRTPGWSSQTPCLCPARDNGRCLLYVFPPFKMVPQVLQKVAQSQGVQLILITPLQETAS